jgi:hypothetical protein
MTVNGYSPFVAMQNNQRTDTHEITESSTVGRSPCRSAILRFLRKLRMASHWLLEKDAKNALRSPAKRDEVGLVLS